MWAAEQTNRHAQAARLHHTPGRAEFSLRFDGRRSLLRRGETVALSTGSPTPSSRPTLTRSTITWGCDLKNETRNAGVQTTEKRSTGEKAMKGLIGLTALAVIFGCGSAQAQYSDGTIRIGVMTDHVGPLFRYRGAGLGGRRAQWRSRIRCSRPRA